MALQGLFRLRGIRRRSPGAERDDSAGAAAVDGLLFYGPGGAMSATLTLGPASPVAVRGSARARARDALNRYSAYWGTFEVDPSGKEVIHSVEGGFAPGLGRGSSLRRAFELAGDRLVLTATTADRGTLELTWRRVAQPTATGVGAALAGRWEVVAERQGWTGVVWFAASGHIAIQLANTETIGKGVELAVTGYRSHFGRYAADGAQIVLDVAGSLDPGLAGTRITLAYRMSGADQLDIDIGGTEGESSPACAIVALMRRNR